jgi:serine/threonine protein kinase
MFRFLRCVGQAVVAQGMRGLMGIVPFGEQIFDVARDSIERYRQLNREKELAADLELVVQAEVAIVRDEVAQIVLEVAADRPVEEQRQLAAYLTQIPSVARQSLRRPDDLAGTTVPATLHLNDPIQLSAILPQRPSRFQAGQKVPDAPQWTLQQLLGAGGFGEVWLASHTFLDERRAVKFCLDPAARDRLLRHEGEVIKRVMQASQSSDRKGHGIVPLLDAHLEGLTPWLAYEYVDGGDLAGLVRPWAASDPAIRAKNALRTLQTLAGVVGRLHRFPEPILHRDLKPANVLVQKTEQGFRLRITDFGISHVAAACSLRQASVSTPSMSLGETFRGAHTPIYASPQQKRCMKPDPRDDVHALGIIGWQMLLGDLSAERPAGKWRKRVADCKLSEATLDLLESCWDDEPSERPRDAMELVERLAECMGEAKVVEVIEKKQSYKPGEIVTLRW